MRAWWGASIRGGRQLNWRQFGQIEQFNRSPSVTLVSKLEPNFPFTIERFEYQNIPFSNLYFQNMISNSNKFSCFIFSIACDKLNNLIGVHQLPIVCSDQPSSHNLLLWHLNIGIEDQSMFTLCVTGSTQGGTINNIIASFTADLLG